MKVRILKGLGTLCILITTMGSASALDRYHLNLGHSDLSRSVSIELEKDTRDGFTQYAEPAREVESAILNFDQPLGSHTLHWGTGQAENERTDQFGISFKNTRVYGFTGYGHIIANLANPFANIDRFHFHGGLETDYDFSGYHLDYRLTKSHQLGLSHANIKSNRLEDRSVYALTWQGGRHSLRYRLSLMEVKVGDKNAGHVMAVGADSGNHHFALQGLKANNDASYVGLSYRTELKRGKVLGINLERKRNPLFETNNDNRITFSLGVQLGAQTTLYARETRERGKGNATTYTLIGIGIVGAATSLSSGSSDADSAARFRTQTEVARDVLNNINPTSIAQNREYGGYVFRNADGSFASTSPIRGEVASVLLPDPSTAAPEGTRVTASYHTHAAFDPEFKSEIFSSTDLSSNRALGIDGYLGTPKGQFKFHDVSTGDIITLGGPGSLATQ